MSHATDATARPARPTLFDHIGALADPGSFVPAPAHLADAAAYVGDGASPESEGGEALIDGRPVTIGHSGHIVTRALALRHPYVALSSGTGGLARGGRRNLGVLDTVWGMSGGPMLPEMCVRQRSIPVASALVRHSFGDATFFTGLSDFVVQLRGTCMALTSPRVLAVGTSEQVTMEELGGVEVHRRNGQADIIADTLDDVYAAIRRFLSYLPTRAGAALPVTAAVPPAARTPAPGDARRLIGRLLDSGSFFELKPDYAPSLVTGLARLDGVPVGVVASDAATDDGAYSADACQKAARLVCTCDGFGLPLLFLVDSPGPRREPSAAISRAMTLAQAIALAEVPKCWVLTGRAFGAGLLMTGPARVATDLVVAWPGARTGYYDDSAAQAGAPDGIVTPEGTRARLAAHLRTVLGPAPLSRPGGTLRNWPVAW